jgi:hypothetical protein
VRGRGAYVLQVWSGGLHQNARSPGWGWSADACAPSWAAVAAMARVPTPVRWCCRFTVCPAPLVRNYLSFESCRYVKTQLQLFEHAAKKGPIQCAKDTIKTNGTCGSVRQL